MERWDAKLQLNLSAYPTKKGADPGSLISDRKSRLSLWLEWPLKDRRPLTKNSEDGLTRENVVFVEKSYVGN